MNIKFVLLLVLIFFIQKSYAKKKINFEKENLIFIPFIIDKKDDFILMKNKDDFIMNDRTLLIHRNISGDKIHFHIDGLDSNKDFNKW
jgi:hypothetical protein